MPKKSLLIVSYYFAPQNEIGAVRMTKLAKYLARLGHDVTVLCGAGAAGLQDPTLVRDLEALGDVHMIREWNPIRDRKAKARKAPAEKTASPAGEPAAMGPVTGPEKGKNDLKRSILRALYLALNQWSDHSFYRRCLRSLNRMNRRFDVVLSSYGPLSNHHIARKAKAKGIAAEWIADFRDVVEMPFRWQRGWARSYVRKVIEGADQITGVSKGYLATMGLERTGAAIPNGFDTEDLQGIAAEPRKGGESLRFVYCGQMYGAQRDLRPFFQALSELIAEGAIARDDLSLEYAGKAQDAVVFDNQAAAFHLEGLVKNHGRVPRDEAIRLQLSADAILIAAWNTPECIGNLPGKLLEGLMMERPVICCVAGKVPHSEAASVIRRTGMGYCYEEAEGESSYQGLKGYLRTLCAMFLKGSPFPFAPDRVAVASYAYAHVAQKFSTLIQGRLFDGS